MITCSNEMVSLGDTAISLHILQSPRGRAKKIGVWKFGGGCSAKGQVWTRGRKLEFGNLGGGVFRQRSDLDLGKKIGVWKLGGGGCSVPNFRIGCSCQFGQKILEAQLAFASQIVSHILRMWRLITLCNDPKPCFPSWLLFTSFIESNCFHI